MSGWTRVSNSIESAPPSAAAQAAPASPSPSRRAWLRFKRNRTGFWSLVAFVALVLLSLGAELVSNDKPLIA
ncbi:MAG: ABC transporter permease, partial [Burkholderiaceae bacterium]|nr:ABC transporter permease [Burkholderiaceae bacterium]